MGKFLSASGVTRLWNKVTSYVTSVKTAIEASLSSQKSTLETAIAKKQDKLTAGTGISIGSDGTIGVTLDVTLYKVVETLPTADIDENKIYLVKGGTSGTDNIYIEYMYVNSAWEKVGEYKSDVDLTPYAKTADVTTQLATKADKSDTYTKSEVDAKVTASGTFSDTEKTKLAGIEAGAEVNVIETVKVDGTALTVTDKAVNIDLSGKQDKLTAGTNVTISGTTISAKDTTYGAATTSAAGLMSASDKSKLDAIASGATKTTVDTALSSTSTNPVQNKVVNSALAGKQATLTAGDNITISGTTISAKDTTYSAATTSAAGLMSASDKNKLDAIATGATADEALTDAEIDAACQ